jgi:hypothetical protein
VEARVEEAFLAARWGPGILRLPDAAKRIADPSDGARDALLADASRLEDPEPGTRLALWALEGGSLRVRLRAVDALGDLLSWGGDAARIAPALAKALGDPSAAVRDLALERLADAGEPAALDGALELCGLPAEEEAEVRGVVEKRCPGDRALEILTRASRIRFGLDPEGFRALEEGERKALLEEFRAWRTRAGGAALRNGEEGPFDPVPKVTTAIVDGRTADAATVRWWSEVDRAQFRLDLEELRVVASSKLDWSAGFRLTVVASGARQGNWEAFARRLRCGARHRLPRKGFGLVETSIQPLLDGRWRVRVFAYESRGG